MLTLDEMALRVLSELEEAGAETVVTLLATVTPRTGQASELHEVAQAIARLVRLELVQLSIDRDATGHLRRLSKEASLAALQDVLPNLAFDATSSSWSDNRNKVPPFRPAYPYVVATSGGLVQAREILDARGYQWWRPQSR